MQIHSIFFEQRLKKKGARVADALRSLALL
jgi:hypothetical protein